MPARRPTPSSDGRRFRRRDTERPRWYAASHTAYRRGRAATEPWQIQVVGSSTPERKMGRDLGIKGLLAENATLPPDTHAGLPSHAGDHAACPGELVEL